MMFCEHKLAFYSFALYVRHAVKVNAFKCNRVLDFALFSAYAEAVQEFTGPLGLCSVCGSGTLQNIMGRGCVLAAWRLALLEKKPVVQLLKNSPTIYGTRRFITVFTRALHWSLSCVRSISPYHPIPSKIHFNITHPPTFLST
jgi:hypothetical protein